MSDPHRDSGYSGGVVGGAVQTTGKIVDAISNPVLIFLIVFTALVVGGVVYIWHAQRVEALSAYTHLVDVCLPSKEKD